MDVLVDTNVLVSLVNKDNQDHNATESSTEKLVERGYRLCVTSQNLVELWAVCTRPVKANGLGLTVLDAELALHTIEKNFVRVADSDDVYPEWRHLVLDNSISGKQVHDARLVAAMNVHRITHILTFNAKDFERFQSITVIDPASVK